MNDEAVHDLLLQACRDLNISVSPIGTVSEADADRLFGMCERFFRNARLENRPVAPYHRISNRVVYTLRDLSSAFVATRRT